MKPYLIPKKKADAISNGAFLVALGIIFYTNSWWPGILVAIWLALAIRQYFTNRIYDLCLTTIILIGLFLISLFNFDWSVLMPVLFVVGGIYIIFREYFFAEDTNGEDKSQEMQDDFDDTKRP
jgi:predicted membrane protein